jgi:hypothetical protein
MIIQIKKFGKMLISRPAGKEAAAVILSSFKPASESELIELDFTGVEVIAPSWLEEVLFSLKDVYGDRVRCLESDNSSLRESLKVIQDLS